MGLFYKRSDKEILKLRNKIFLEKGLPLLKQNGFHKSTFKGIWFGGNNLGYFYELCRLSNESHLEIISIQIVRGDSWIKTFINVFELTPILKSLDKLDGIDGIKFHLPPNKMSKMRIEDFLPNRIFTWNKEHRIRTYYSEWGLNRRIKELSNLIEKDLGNIDSFIQKWHKIHTPIITTYDGNPICEV
jgi:hypothetical protein